MVFETLQILSGLIDKDRVALMKEYEDRLIKAYNLSTPTNTIVEFIVAAEQFNLKNLLSTAIRTARNWNRTIQKSARYNEISDKSKLEIYEQQRLF